MISFNFLLSLLWHLISQIIFFIFYYSASVKVPVISWNVPYPGILLCIVLKEHRILKTYIYIYDIYTHIYLYICYIYLCIFIYIYVYVIYIYKATFALVFLHCWSAICFQAFHFWKGMTLSRSSHAPNSLCVLYFTPVCFYLGPFCTLIL